MPDTGAWTIGRKAEAGTLTFACYSSSDYCSGFKIFSFATGEPGKVQVLDLVRVVGIVASFVPRESVPGENSFYRAPGGGVKLHRRPAPGAPNGGTVHYGIARQSSETGPYGDCIMVLWVPGP